MKKEKGKADGEIGNVGRRGKSLEGNLKSWWMTERQEGSASGARRNMKR